MFEYEFRTLEKRFNEVIEIFKKTRALPNPGGLVRFCQHLLQPPGDDETFADKQARIDDERKELEKSALEIITSCKDDLVSILDWLEERGISRPRLSPKSFSYFSVDDPLYLSRWLADLKEIQQLVELTEEAEKAAEEKETRLRDELEQIAEERSVNLKVKIT